MTKPSKDVEFHEFIKLLKKADISTYQIMAEALGVTKNTITSWARIPEAREARIEGISHALEQMKVAGKSDWRMWEARLKMLGVNPAIKVDNKHGASDPVLDLLEKFGLKGKDNAGQTEDSAETTPPSGS